jgi:WD40 repeat protein
LSNVIPHEVKEKLPATIMKEDWNKRAKSFWIYETKNGNLIKRLDSIVIPYTDSGFISLGSKVSNDDDKLITASGSIVKKADGTKLAFADEVTSPRNLYYAPFCFSGDSNNIIVPLLGGGYIHGFIYGVLAEEIDIQSNKLKNVYAYSDYDKVKEYVSKGNSYKGFMHFGPIETLARSGDGKYLALLGNSYHFALFETETGKVVSYKRATRDDAAIDACYGFFVLNYDGSMLAYSCSSPNNSHPKSVKLVADNKGDFRFNEPRGCKVVIKDTKTAEIKTTILTPDPLIITSIAFSKNNKYIATGTIWGHVFVWNTSNGKLVKRFSLEKNHRDLKNMTKTITSFYKDSDEIITVYLERHNKSGYVYKYKISNNNKEKLFDFPP